MVITVFVILITLVLSALFSGSELAYLSANKLGIEVMKNKGHKRGQLLAGFYDNPRSFLGTMLVGNNIALVIFTMFMTTLLEPVLDPILGVGSIISLLAITLLITIVVLVFGEFLPKTIFRLYANELLYRLAYILSFFKWLLAIPTLMMTGLSNFFLKTVLKVPVDDVTNVFTRIDLEHYIQDNLSEEETIDKEILTNALNLSSVKVRECMVPRMEMISIEKTASLEEIIAVFKESNLSRILITTDGDIENTEGYLHHQQLISNPKSIKKLILPIAYVPEAMNVQDLLLTFTKQGSNIACVVDEFGGVAGLITLEDILEEIFGEIEDEHDDEAYTDEQINDSEYLFSGRLEVDYLNEKYELLDIPDSSEYTTLSGYLVMTAENIPDVGEEISLGDYKYVIEEVGDTKIETVRVFKNEQEDDEDAVVQ